MMYYREVEYNKRKPKKSANVYFYKVHSNGLIFGFYKGYIGHMESHMKEHPGHEIAWLEPECEYDSDIYYKRISRQS